MYNARILLLAVSTLFLVGLASCAQCDYQIDVDGGTSGTDGGSRRDPGPSGDECSAGQKKPCYEGPRDTKNVGLCRPGTKRCLNGWWDVCLGQVLPTEEVCNGLDDNCNGLVDEKLNCGCSTGDTRDCYEGPPQTRGKGICKLGKQTCTMTPDGVRWGPCKGQVLPLKETCNGKDDDCDGTVDEGCAACKAGQVRSCYQGPPNTRGKGRCKAGAQSCVNGKWSVCKGQVLPVKEVCNGVDDDCDGVRDEDWVYRLNRPCAAGVGACQRSGKYVCSKDGKGVRCSAVPGKPKPETCNGKDDNCDVHIDNHPGSKVSESLWAPCFLGPAHKRKVGACKDGISRCQSGRWQPCKGQVLPKAEVCNGVDDDCNGKIDDRNPPCTCKSGTRRSCYTGPSGTLNKGACRAGNQVCSNGKWGPCSGQVLPRGETCNGIDDDCNGVVDDGSQRVFYRDQDGDGFGVASQTTKACHPPPGYAFKTGDCYDKNKQVYPGQMNFFTVHRGDGSFDYNCDGNQQKRYTRAGTCGKCSSIHSFVEGFEKPLPACGKVGKYVWQCFFDMGKCKTLYRPQCVQTSLCQARCGSAFYCDGSKCVTRSGAVCSTKKQECR